VLEWLAEGRTMSEVNRDCKECGRWVEDTHEGVPFVDGTAMCMECFEEDYKHIGQKVMDAMKRGGLFDEEVETSDEQWFDDPEWIELNRGEPFDVAWDSITKAPFHGTSSDKLEQIMQEGLKPTGGQYFQGPRKRLFFSREPSGAIHFARQKAEKNKSDPILIHFPDEEDLQHPKPKGELVHNHPFTTKTIPPERLSIFEGPKFPPGNPYTGNPKAVADYHLWDRRLDSWGREMDKMREWLEGNL